MSDIDKLIKKLEIIREVILEVINSNIEKQKEFLKRNHNETPDKRPEIYEILRNLYIDYTHDYIDLIIQKNEQTDSALGRKNIKRKNEYELYTRSLG